MPCSRSHTANFSKFLFRPICTLCTCTFKCHTLTKNLFYQTCFYDLAVRIIKILLLAVRLMDVGAYCLPHSLKLWTWIMEKLTCWIPWRPWSRRTPAGAGPGCPPPATLPPPGPTSGQRPWPGCGRKLAAQWEVSYFRFWAVWFAQNSWEEMQRPLRTLIIWECYQNSKNGAVGNQLTDDGRVFSVSQ